MELNFKGNTQIIHHELQIQMKIQSYQIQKSRSYNLSLFHYSKNQFERTAHHLIIKDKNKNQVHLFLAVNIPKYQSRIAVLKR